MKTLKHARSPRSKRGSILLIVLVTMSALSMFALAATDNTRSMIEVSAAERLKARAEAAADSALAFADKQLALDENWGGSGWVSMADDSRFRVVRQLAMNPDARHYIIEAENNDAVVRLYAKFTVDKYEAPVLQHALATLGGSVDMQNVHLTGDLLVVDTQAGVKDYSDMTGEWETRDTGGDPLIDSVNNTIDGNLMSYTGEVPGIAYTGDNVQMFGPVINPRWDLDPYLTASPDRIITTQTNFKKVVTDKTVVVVAPMGASVNFTQCDISGGVVVWSPPDWPQRGPAYNNINWSACEFGTPSTTPGSTGIGLLAPGSELNHGRNTTIGHGLFAFHSVDTLNNADLTGSLWVTNGIDNLANVDVTYDPAIATVGYEGMAYDATYTFFDSVIPYHDEPVEMLAQ